MQEKIKSEGKCLFCGKTFAKASINRHLATHLNKKNNEEGISFLIKV
jgi:penicillin-binding protein-related factor A (putative recombinase)